MAIGRQDYMQGVIPVMSSLNPSLAVWGAKVSTTVTAGETKNIIISSPGAGFRGYVMTFGVSCDGAGIHEVTISSSDASQPWAGMYMRVDQAFNWRAVEPGALRFDETTQFRMTFKNFDDVTLSVLAYMQGIRETIFV